MLLVFMICIKELTNQILLPGTWQLLTVHSQVNGGVYMLTAFASFLEDSEGEEISGLGEGPYCLPIAK